MYDEGVEPDRINNRLLNHEDPVIASVARDILIEKYEITVENYKSSLTSVTTRLVQYVPKSLLVYHMKKAELKSEALAEKMASAGEEEVLEILQEIQECNKMRNRLNNELGRV